jgi:glycosyltransferase involved in cell wall biosynthesis
MGSRESVESGRSGFVVPPEDPEALADAIVNLLDDPDLRHRFGEAARDRIAARFDIEQASAALTELYHSVVKERNH